MGIGPAEPRAAAAFPINNVANSERVYVATAPKLFSSTNGGASFTEAFDWQTPSASGAPSSCLQSSSISLVVDFADVDVTVADPGAFSLVARQPAYASSLMFIGSPIAPPNNVLLFKSGPSGTILGLMV